MKFDKRIACLVGLCFFVATSVGAADAAQVVSADSTDYGKPTTGVLRALIVNIGTPSLPARPRNEFAASVATAAQQINQLSRGLTTVQTEYFGRDILLNDVANLCDAEFDSWQAAVSKQVDISPYRFVTLIIPFPDEEAKQCEWDGISDMPGKFSYDFSPPSDQDSNFPNMTVAHEWGHNMTLDHMSQIICKKNGSTVSFVSRAERDKSCKKIDYSTFSFMGSESELRIMAGERSQLGWLRAGEEQEVTEGTFTLGADGPLSLLWLKNAEGDRFQIEFVKALNPNYPKEFFDVVSDDFVKATNGWTHDGVIIKFMADYEKDAAYPNGYMAHPHIIDTSPETAIVTDSALKAGKSFVDPTGTFQIDVLEVTGASATVRIGKPTGAVAATKITITCVKGKKTRNATGLNPQCPKGFLKI